MSEHAPSGRPSDHSGAGSCNYSDDGQTRPAPPPNAPLLGPDAAAASSQSAAQASFGPRIPADVPAPRERPFAPQTEPRQQAEPGRRAEPRGQAWDALRSAPKPAETAPAEGGYPFATEMPRPGDTTPGTSAPDSGPQETPDAAETAAPDEKGKKSKAAPKEEKPTRPVTPGPFNGKSLGPLLAAQPMQRGPDGSFTPVPPTLLSRLYAALGYAPLLIILLVLAAQVLFTLDARALWYSDEVRHANAFQSMVRDGHWLVLHMNGEAYPDKPPLYFWFLALIQMVMQLVIGKAPEPQLFFIGTAVSGLLLLLASHALARLVARVDGKTALGAGLILLSGFFFSGLLHYSRMDLLFAACITLSHVFLFHAWMRERASGLMVLGFALAGVATLVKGPLGLAFPLLAGIGFVLWQGRPGRLFRADTFLGLLIGLALPAAWLGAAWMTAGDSFIDNIVGQQIVARAVDTWHHGQPWYYYFMAFPAIFLPWSLLLLFLPWQSLFGKQSRAAVSASRTPELAGLAYLWAALLTGFALLSVVSIKLPIYLLPLFPPLAIPAARALLRLSPGRSKALQYTLALLLLIMAVALILLPLLPRGMTAALPVIPAGTFILGGICLVAACGLGFLPDARRPEGSLLLLALFSALFAYPAWSISAPSLDVFMSPKAQAEKIKELKAQGYKVFSSDVYAGTYSYYAGDVPRIKEWSAVLQAVKPLPKAAVAMRANAWDKLKDKPEGFAEVQRQIIAERTYVLIAKPAPAGAAAPAKAAPAPSQAPQKPTPAPTDAPKPESKAPAAPAANATSPAPQNAAPAPTPKAAPEAARPATPAVAPREKPQTERAPSPANATQPVTQPASQPAPQAAPPAASPSAPAPAEQNPVAPAPQSAPAPQPVPSAPAAPAPQAPPVNAPAAPASGG